MKIALTGSHGTGKTTLLNRVAVLLRARSELVAVCRETPRVIIGEVGDDTFFRRESNTPLRQLLVLFRQIIEENIKADKVNIVLTDRTVVDHLAYTIELFPEIEGMAEGRALVAAVQEWVGQYDLIIKLPIEFPPVDDGVREGEVAFQASIDRTIDRLYERVGVVPTVVHGSVDERANEVLTLLNALQHNGTV